MRRPVRVILAMLVAATGLGAVAGCAEKRRPVNPEVDLHNPSATRRLEAVAAAGRAHDEARVPALFACLDDDDEAVRMAAAAVLSDWGGPFPAYRAYLPREERLAAARAWRATWDATRGRSSVRDAGGVGYTKGPADGPPR
ncbi:MAG: HEAT repeat domain-containing protein [Planctomycetes bacterium]|nr:HEAT repeat domain-containing protein [Planctomycetota bacterium]